VGLLIAIGALHKQRARARATLLQQLTSTLGVPLAASVDDSENELSEIKTQVKMLLRKLNQNSEPQASIESGSFTIQYVYSSFYASRTLRLQMGYGRAFNGCATTSVGNLSLPKTRGASSLLHFRLYYTPVQRNATYITPRFALAMTPLQHLT
jgi:hypothetical protein